MSILTIENKCHYTVWPVIYSWNSQVSTTGFTLKKGESRDIRAPSSWYGIISGRTLCSAAHSTGKFWCATGDCESGKIECPNEDYGWSPVTYAYFRIDHNGYDTYTISVEYGYNLPLMIVPTTKSTSGTCITTSCVVDLNKTCPKDLVKFSREKPIACSSSCQESDDTPEICCTNEYKSKENCKPTMYTKNFGSACPLAYVYAYDDNNSTFTCPNSTDYVITFCPSSISNTIRYIPVNTPQINIYLDFALG